MAALPADMPKRVIAVSGLKGGIGKSTLAMFIAFVYAVVHGLRVLYVDADPSSQTGWDWWKTARDNGSPLPFDIETWSHARVGDMVVDRTPGQYDAVVIDCGGDSDAILRSAVGVCTYALIVTTPNKADMRRVAATFSSALKAAREVERAGDIDAAIVFTKVDNRREARNLRMRAQAEDRLPVLKSDISLLSAYSDAMCENVTSRDDLKEVEALVEEMEAA